ncbi:BolA family transcriptional regulator [Roseovarius sp. SCSIO 43702]|uniref:BolA family protein n=1 Tax=Roseovarius sp. SCSIO 43702 TaxID=2823043 RepID=UPI001C736AF0|nr:BolA family protein [Roseovarius sp. SCSIO 43702]QYX58164.1 BolA family transcriptional regulator [Roseovarius sp. SCSIO 43702]
MTRSEEIRARLDARFGAGAAEVVDESEAHRGHAGYQEGGESHFRVRIRAPELEKSSRISRHRAVHAAIGPDLMGRIHALAIEIETAES